MTDDSMLRFDESPTVPAPGPQECPNQNDGGVHDISLYMNVLVRGGVVLVVGAKCSCGWEDEFEIDRSVDTGSDPTEADR